MMEETPKAIDDFMSRRATPDETALQLSSGEVEALQEQLAYVEELALESSSALRNFSRAFRSMQHPGVSPPGDLAVLSEQAEVYAEKALLAFSLAHEINTTIDARFEHELDALLGALDRKD